MRRLALALLGAALVACGGTPAPAAPPEDEVGATWTAGDDAPLGDPEGEGSEPGAAEPGGD